MCTQLFELMLKSVGMTRCKSLVLQDGMTLAKVAVIQDGPLRLAIDKTRPEVSHVHPYFKCHVSLHQLLRCSRV